MEHSLDKVALWNSFLEGNKDAFNLIFKSSYSDLFHYGTKISNSPEITKEAIQQLFIKLWEKRSKLPPVNAVNAYLLKSLRRNIFDLIKKEKKLKLVPLEGQLENQFYEFSIEERMINESLSHQKRQAISKAIEKLNPNQREILYLKFYNNLSYQEISEILNISYQTVRNYMSQALKSLKKTEK